MVRWLGALLILTTAPGALDGPRAENAARTTTLIRATGDVDARDRELGTALDVAEKEGQATNAAQLRARGARGSGKSVGDIVCVTPWEGYGFCGRVQSRSGNRLRLGLLWLEGCAGGCAPDPECSGGRRVGGAEPRALQAGDEVLVPSWCLTRTAVQPRR
jgi:hypothetical protein